MLEIKYIKM